ncbi:hypothetical protein MB27_17405 [Actinoplanes utahensis]|uniref:Uncharacterized protein n=1 Tax=Actinoplanes utahensis TaxID=1869 RepID=A0A0A6UK22_ACTUT|nr:hypothetical protein MB27_17405 [Actinoplanes utahensis]
MGDGGAPIRRIAAYPRAVPVSRKRKKVQRSAAAVKADRRREHVRRVRAANEVREMLAGWTAGDARRTEEARPHAGRVIGALLASPRTGIALEDELCARLGEVPDEVAPRHLAEALADAAGVLPEDDAAAERVRMVVAGVLPARFRPRTGLDAPDPLLKEPALWTRDRAGTRFAVCAPFGTPDGPVRWYLWGLGVSGYYASPEEALVAWQVGIGPAAAGGTVWHEVDDWPLVAGLLSADTSGAAEFLRSRRLAEVLLSRHAAPGNGG